MFCIIVERKAWSPREFTALVGDQRSLQVLPRINDRKEQQPVVEVLHDHRLAAAGLQQTRRVRCPDLSSRTGWIGLATRARWRVGYAVVYLHSVRWLHAPRSHRHPGGAPRLTKA